MKWVWFFSIYILSVNVYTQSNRVVFWNVENLFDTINDPNKNDDEFTSMGIRNWNSYRYKKKIHNLAQTIVGIGEWELPMIIGLCEVENRSVLYDLTHHELLRKGNYQIVHYETADARGIDPAIIYDPNRFKVFESGYIPLVYNGDSLRHILWAKGEVCKGETLIVYMNHWPSKYSGVIATQPKRLLAAMELSKHIKFMLVENPDIRILVGGDFNDEREEESIKALERESGLICMIDDNTSYSHKYREKWSLIDLVFGTKNLGLKIEAKVFKLGLVLEKDEKNLGERPNRTYIGYSYHGGVSDHLPVYIDICK